MNTFRLYFLRQFANTVQKALSTPIEVPQNDALNIMLSRIDHAKNIGDSSSELSQVNENFALSTPKANTESEHLSRIQTITVDNSEEYAALETQPIEPNIVAESDLISTQTSSSEITKNLEVSLSNRTLFKEQTIKHTLISQSQTAANFFPSLPWLQNELAVTLENNIFSSSPSTHFKFSDPWDTQTAETFFQAISWHSPSQKISISAGEGAPFAVIQPTILKNQVEQGLVPVLNFFGALPWKG